MASLLEQNPYLRDPKKRAESIRLSAATSSAVEGIRKPFATSAKPPKTPSRKTTKSGK
jgi:hypothetical protein